MPPAPSTLPDRIRDVLARAGSPLADLVVRSVPRPRDPIPGEVLIKVGAAGVNSVDVKSRQGRGAAAFVDGDTAADAREWVPGWDVAGRVAATGRGVARFGVGDRVSGTVNVPRSGNGYAEYVIAPVAHICETPHRLDDVEAAALPMAGLTAWQAMVNAAGLRPGHRVLVTAAAGGVGHLAVQIARDRGAFVIALASPANLDFVAGLGAHQIVDRTKAQWTEAIAPVDVVLDMFGGNGSGLAELGALITPGGTLVTVSSASADGAAARGAVLPHVSAVLPLERAGQAHELMDGGRTRGKIVLAIAAG